MESDLSVVQQVDCDEKEKESESTDEESGKFVRRNQSNSGVSSEDEENSDELDLQKRYAALLLKMKDARKKKLRKQSSPEDFRKKSLADKIRGWQTMELEKMADHREQYYSWLSFKSTMEANWQMYDVIDDPDKLICLRTKCKGFIVELINSLQRANPDFQEIWDGLQTRFYAPIDSGEETSHFYQMKQIIDENIFNFFERVTKQAYLCDFAESECNKRIGETFSRNCLNPGFFLGVLDKFDDLDKLKHHARNFHAALPKSKSEPVLAIESRQRNPSAEFKPDFKRRSERSFDDSHKRRRFDEPRDQRRYRFPRPRVCKYCANENCGVRNCPARGTRCTYCQRLDHFENACFRKKSDNMNKIDMSVNAVKDEDVQQVNNDGKSD